MRLAACRGAVASLLGPDYFMPPGNSHMHVANPGDQGFHKDDTGHGPTMGTVRDHRLRHVLALFYPQDTSSFMGPTSVIPGSQYPGLDREGAHTSEQHLSLPLSADEAAALEEPLPPPEVEGAMDRHRIADAKVMLGRDDVTEVKLVVPAGSLVLCHHDLFHRGSRALVDSVPWRPMFGIRNLVRGSDPVAPTWNTDDGADREPVQWAFAYTGASPEAQCIYGKTTPAVWLLVVSLLLLSLVSMTRAEEMWSYMRGEAQTGAAGGKDAPDQMTMLEIFVPVVAEHLSFSRF